MKKVMRVIGTILLLGAMSLSVVSAATPKAANENDAATLSVLYAAMRSRVFIQTVAKDYLYIGNDIATTKAQKEMAVALKKFDVQQKMLQEAITDPKVKNLMTFVKMNVDEIKEVLKKPYSLENAQEIIDLAEAISEGNKKIAQTLRKKLSKNYPSGKGQRYLLNQIAKYYMAYQAGIKDENTVRHMKKTVEKFDKLLQEMKAYPDNTVKMNQVLNHAENLWKIVKQFYIDIKEGGLPVIVYQTTRKIDKDMITYSRLIAPKAVVK